MNYKKYKCQHSGHIWILLKYLDNRKYAIFYNIATNRYKVYHKEVFSTSKKQSLFKLDDTYYSSKKFLLFPNGIEIDHYLYYYSSNFVIYHIIEYDNIYKYVGKNPHKGYGVYECGYYLKNTDDWKLIKNIKLLESL